MNKQITLCQITLTLTSLLFSSLIAAKDINYFLNNSTIYQTHIPTPKSALHFDIGEWHARPEQIDRYFHLLANSSPRMKLVITGYTHEKRPTLMAFISSPKNIAQLERLRLKHLNNEENAPIVTWLGFSVHGNEASGSNASMLAAYHYVAAEDEQTLAQLNDQIIMIDPMLNPDGLARFAHWANSYKSKTPVSDPNTMEHNEIWPGARTNHYWFDLNRDWLPVQHPESQARLKMFHQWRPNILTDHHEMGTDKTFFFQPGVKARTNPLTPQDNFNMTAKIAEYHAKALDDIGSLYYSKESYDDFYYGKGSTYPDIHGSVGILFEQASARGHVQNAQHGKITFDFAIRNQLTTALSTITAAQNLQAELREMRRIFLAETSELAKKDKIGAIVFGSNDRYRTREMERILSTHKIEVYPLAKSISKKEFNTKNSYIIPLAQNQYRLIKSLFEIRKDFKSDVFYDVSAWNMALALDLNYTELTKSQFSETLLGPKVSEPRREFVIGPETIALAFDWNNFSTAQILVAMQKLDIKSLGTTKKLTLLTQTGLQSLNLGSLVVPLSNDTYTRNDLISKIGAVINKFDVQPVQITSGLAVEGVDMGSPSLPVLQKVIPLLIIGDGIRSYDAGEVWHLLDQRLSQDLTMVSKLQLTKLSKLNQYTHLILVDGKYAFDKKTTAKIEAWIKQGGVLIAHSRGAEWLISQNWTSSKLKEYEVPTNSNAPYEQKSALDAKHVIGGAIAASSIDISHPLAFGLDNKSLSIFKRTPNTFTVPDQAFVSIAKFNTQALAAGYMSEENRHHIKGGTSIFVQSLGRGKIIAFSDNPLFRAFWLGTTKVFTNALYYGKVIQAPKKLEIKSAASH
jgi:hypothetical protein